MTAGFEKFVTRYLSISLVEEATVEWQAGKTDQYIG